MSRLRGWDGNGGRPWRSGKQGAAWLSWDCLQAAAPPAGCCSSPCGDGASLTLSLFPRNGPYSPPHPLFSSCEKQAPRCLLQAAFVSQDWFRAAECHLFALLDQHEKYRVCAWDADRWPLAASRAKPFLPAVSWGHLSAVLQTPVQGGITLVTHPHQHSSIRDVLAGCYLLLPLQWQTEGRNG